MSVSVLPTSAKSFRNDKLLALVGRQKVLDEGGYRRKGFFFFQDRPEDAGGQDAGRQDDHRHHGDEHLEGNGLRPEEDILLMKLPVEAPSVIPGRLVQTRQVCQ